MANRTAVAVAVPMFALVAIGLMLWRPSGKTIVPRTALLAPPPASVATPDAQAPGSTAAFRTGLEHLPASLKGTEVPGDLKADADGNLIINRGVRSFFDYFLSANAEEPATAIRARVAVVGKTLLPSRAVAQLMAIYDQYVTYLARAGEAVAQVQGQDLTRITERLAMLRRIRSETLPTEVVRAFFGDEDSYDDYEMAKAAILQDTALSATDKAAKLALLRDQLPEALRQGMAVAEIVQTLDQVTSEWQQRGGTAQELHDIREQMVGDDATQRLEALDVQNAQWSARVADYMGQRDRIMGDSTLSDVQRQDAITALRQQNFSGGELIRIATLDEIRASAATPVTASH